MYGLNCGLRKISEDNDSKGKGKKSGRISLDMAHTIDYVICILLSQGTNTSSLMRENICSQSNHSCKLYLILGGYFSGKKLALRSVAAVWCLSCFVLIQSYSSVLISVMTLPKLKPIINSVYDIPKISGLQVVANRGMAVQAALSVRKCKGPFINYVTQFLALFYPLPSPVTLFPHFTHVFGIGLS